MKKNVVIFCMICLFSVVLKATDTLQISSFDELSLDSNGYWNGSDTTGGFISGIVFFPNAYNFSFGSWAWFAYSSVVDDTTAGYGNQYSSFAPGAFSGDKYAVTYVETDWMSGLPIPNRISFTDSSAHVVKGFYISNNTYAALSMRDGDMFAKKFGGVSGNDPDYLRVIFKGYDQYNLLTDSVLFYLADYTGAEQLDTIIKDWTWVDLQPLGKVSRVEFYLQSTDTGMFGINTPTYFCMDDLTVLRDFPPYFNDTLADIFSPDTVNEINISLNGFVTDSDDSDTAIRYSIYNSDSAIADVAVLHDTVRIKPLSGGTAEIILVALSNHKEARDTFNVIITPVTLVHGHTFAQARLFPNPAGEQIVLRSSCIGNAEIYSAQGVKLMNMQVLIGENIISLTDLPSGCYYLVLSDTETRSIKRFIKQ